MVTDYSQRLRDLLKDKNMTQKQLADMTGASQQAVSSEVHHPDLYNPYPNPTV